MAFIVITDLLLFQISWALLPGISTMPRAMLAIMYCVSLFWMFLGMNIIADIFMA